MNTKIATALVLAFLMTSACDNSEKAETTTQESLPETQVETTPQNLVTPAPVTPTVVEAAPAQDVPQSVNQTNLKPCPDGAGIQCKGVLIVSATSAALVPYNKSSLQLTTSITVENRTDSDLSFALIGGRAIVNLDNGLNLGTQNQSSSGVAVCREAKDCYAVNSSQFTTLVPGESSGRFTLYNRDRYPPALTPTLPTISTGDITFQILAVTATGEEFIVPVTLSGVPIKNQLAR